MVEQVGKATLLLFVGGQEATCEVLYLLPKTFKVRTRGTLAVHVQACTEVETSLAPPGG